MESLGPALLHRRIECGGVAGEFTYFAKSMTPHPLVPLKATQGGVEYGYLESCSGVLGLLSRDISRPMISIGNSSVWYYWRAVAKVHDHPKLYEQCIGLFPRRSEGGEDFHNQLRGLPVWTSRPHGPVHV